MSSIPYSSSLQRSHPPVDAARESILSSWFVETELVGLKYDKQNEHSTLEAWSTINRFSLSFETGAEWEFGPTDRQPHDYEGKPTNL